MKHPLSILRASTAIMVSLAVVGTNPAIAGAAFGPQDETAKGTSVESGTILLAQAEGKAKGKKKLLTAEELEAQLEAEAAAKVEAEAAAEEAPAEEAPAEEAAAETAEEAPAEAEAQAEEAADEAAEAVEESPAEEVVEEAEEAEEAAATEETVEPLTVETTSEQEAVVEETVTEETVVEETQVEETQVDETTVEETEVAPAETTETEAAETATEESSTETTATGETTASGEAAGSTEASGATAETSGSATSESSTSGTSETTTEAQSDTSTETEAQSGDTAVESEASSETTDEAATDPAVETKVSEEAIEEATTSGEDVIVKEETTSEDLEQSLEKLRQGDTNVDEAKATDVQEEVVTKENSRSSDEEVSRRDDDDDDDDNDVWKYLGAAAAGAAVGALIPALGGRLVQDQGDRVIVERDGEFYVRKDENQLLRQPGVRVQTENFADGITRTTVFREDGSQVVTLRDPGGFILRRTRVMPDGTEIVLIEDSPTEIYSFVDWEDQLPPLQVNIPDDRYVVDYSRANQDAIYQALQAAPVQEVNQTFSLRDVRENERIRALVPRIDLDAIHFATGSAAILPSEAEALSELGRAMAEVIEENPREVFLVEGHTDAVGSNLMNLALSDRRAESVALALTEYYDLPPENLVVQGYGERFLKVATEGPSQENRRATVRRITPLIDRVASNN